MFIASDATLHTCDARGCQGCEVRNRVVCHFTARQLATFWLITLPALVLAGLGTVRFDRRALVPWAVLTALHFGVVEIRVLCSHCPHYAEPRFATLRCWANYGAPKLWHYRPGPMSRAERGVFYLGFTVVLGYPAGCMLASRDWLILLVYLACVVAGTMALRRRYCAYCVNFACPLNRVSEADREAFLARNPAVREAWATHREHR